MKKKLDHKVILLFCNGISVIINNGMSIQIAKVVTKKTSTPMKVKITSFFYTLKNVSVV